MRPTIIKYRRDGSRTFNPWTLEEVLEEIKGTRYKTLVYEYRVTLPLVKREMGEMLRFDADARLDEMPRVCFDSEMRKQGGETVVKAHNPLLVLQVGNLRSQEKAEQICQKATALPYTVMTYTGIDGVSAIIVCRLMPIGMEVVSADDWQTFLDKGYAVARRVYGDWLGCSVDSTRPQLGGEFLLSHDPGAWLNSSAQQLPVDMLSREPSRLMQAGQLLPRVVSDKEEMRQWCHVYIDNVMKAQDELFSAPGNHDYEILLRIASYCHDSGMPQALGERLTVMRSEYADDEALVSKVFTAAYEKDAIEANMEKHRNKTSLLMMRTFRFLHTHYSLRRNVLTGEPQYRLNDGTDFDWHPLTAEVQNTMTIKALESGLESWDKDMTRFLRSELIPRYDPINTWLEQLPQWDGVDRVSELAGRVPTNTPLWQERFHTWMLSMVAQWMGRDDQHGNAIAPILIGAQATGKSSFCRRILPEHLLPYYDDSINFKDEKSVFLALSSFALINIDEFDSLSRAQQPLLKYLLSKTDVKYRASYQSYISAHKRYASFIGTTNKRNPLSDPTGSRRFICVNVTGPIDFLSPIDYEQLYSQLVAEINSGRRYWFTKEEADAITEQNRIFGKDFGLNEMLLSLWRKPTAGEEKPDCIGIDEFVASIREAFPNYVFAGNEQRTVGPALAAAGFERHRRNGRSMYYAIRKNGLK